MNVLLINGSPHEHGCTYTALNQIADELNKQQIETNIFWIGIKPIHGCIGCGTCSSKGSCVFTDDVLSTLIPLVEKADGYIIGSPVHYASPAGSLISLLDRLFYSSKAMCFKPGASIVSARRAGTTASLDVLNKYFTISNMPLVSSQYWTMIHGSKPEDVVKDQEGMQTMRQLARNMAWLLKSIEAGKSSGIALPKIEKREWTNFIK